MSDVIESPGQKAAPRRRRPTDVVLLKDLAPRKDVRGGRAKRLFGEQDEAVGAKKPTSEAAKDKKFTSKKKAVPDLTARRDAAVRGGGKSLNHNETLLRD